MLSGLKHNAAYVTYKETRKAILRKIRLPRYLGSTYRCPVCGTGLNAFKPIWKSFFRKMEEHAYVHPLSSMETFNYQAYSCPSCDASDRERLYTLYLDKLLPTLDSSRRHRMVEFAPSVVLSRRLRTNPRLDYRSADLFRRTVDDNVDITDMKPYADSSLDLFLCSHILEHIPDDRKAMRELYRVLKPGGFGIVMVPLVHGVEETHEDPAIATADERWKHYADGDHVRQYGRRDFIARLGEAGFAVEQLGIDWFGAETFRLAGVAPDSILYVVRKPGVPG
ncbi:MAG: methyltransferase domain-containing protein [Alphaproteobacteria bacterium]|nr:methyltransferase domain-containing protein [Alphaproteobacteria bacterium]